MKRYSIILLVALLAFSAVHCAGAEDVLRVYNASEYIDKTTIADFEKEFGIRVVYDEFDTNEEMYDVITANPSAYDVLIPSDYTIDRLIQEGRLAQIDLGKLPSFSYIAPQYISPEYDPENSYSVPYMVGTLGILYNKRLVTAPIDSWSALFDPAYQGQILMWDSMRDTIGPALKMIGASVNSDADDELAQAKQRLLAQRPLLQAYLGDEIRDRMIADVATLSVLYSGDAKTAIDQNPNLAYVIPREGSNKWVDAFVILKDAENIDAAHKFIDFMCRPNIAIRNMTKTGYTSPIYSIWGEFCENPVMFPSEEELNRCEAFLYNKDAAAKYNAIWAEVRGGY